jgi:hypothetical protein
MITVTVGLYFDKPGYIGLPYWPEKNTLINLAKEVHPKLADAKKQAALSAALEKRGLTMQDYQNLVVQSERPFYTNGSSEIVIPERILQSFINHASMEAPKAIPRVMSKGLTFIGIKVAGGHLSTGMHKASGEFSRFVKMAETNQRSFSSTPYIAEFTATGRLNVDPEVIEAERLRKLLEWGGKWVGMGSARPQGYGRFSVAKWETD